MVCVTVSVDLKRDFDTTLVDMQTVCHSALGHWTDKVKTLAGSSSELVSVDLALEVCTCRCGWVRVNDGGLYCRKDVCSVMVSRDQTRPSSTCNYMGYPSSSTWTGVYVF